MMRSESNRRRGRRRQRRRTLYLRATAVVFNQDDDLLLVKYDGQDDWALPGGSVLAGEDPAERAAIEVEEEIGVHIAQMTQVERYTGTSAAHEIYLAQGTGDPRSNHREIQDTIWWDQDRPLQLQPHVIAILEIVANTLGDLNEDGVFEVDLEQAQSFSTPDLQEEQPVAQPLVYIEEQTPSLPDPNLHEEPPVVQPSVNLDDETPGRNTRRSTTWISVIATVWAWTIVVALWLADCLIWVMLITRSNERRIRPTERKLRLSKERRRELMRQYNYTCVYCGRRRIGPNLDIDHIIPLDRGGLDNESNLQVTCKRCNRSKGNQTDEEFRVRYSRLIPATPLTPPNRPISEKEFNEETKRTRPVESARKFRKTRYIGPREKIRSGCLIAGVVATVLVAYGLSLLGAEGLLMAIPALVVGGAVGLGIWLRADMTGATLEDEG